MPNNKMSKDIVPVGFTIPMAVVDLLPCLFFALASIMLGLVLNSYLMYIGAAISFIGGLIKVIWEFIVVIKKKNVWWMFVQMRITMPLGYLLFIAGFVVACFNVHMPTFWSMFLDPIVIAGLVIGIIGMISMVIFSIKLDSTDPKSNWIEQIANSISQLGFFIAFLTMFLSL